MRVRKPAAGSWSNRIPFTLSFLRHQDPGASTGNHLLYQTRYAGSVDPGNFDWTVSTKWKPEGDGYSFSSWERKGGVLVPIAEQSSKELWVHGLRFSLTDQRGNTQSPLPPNVVYQLILFNAGSVGNPNLPGAQSLYWATLGTGEATLNTVSGFFQTFDRPLVVPAGRYLQPVQRISGTRPLPIYTHAQIYCSVKA